MKFRNRVGVIAAAAVISAVAVAQTVVPAKNAAEAKAAIDARAQHFEAIKKAYEPLGAMLKRQQPVNATLVATNAAKLQELANGIPAKFNVDTRQFKDIKTEARDAIWASTADFKTKSDAMATAAANVVTVAKANDNAGIMKALAEMGKTCGSCHDSFRAKTN